MFAVRRHSPSTPAKPRLSFLMRLLLAGFIVLSLVPRPAAAQQPTARPTMPDSATFSRMAGMFNQMGPMYETMAQAMVDGTLKALERPEIIDRLAAFTRHYYEALIKQGFTKDEALQIVAGVGIPALRTTR